MINELLMQKYTLKSYNYDMPSYPSWPRDGRTSSARTTGWRKGSAPPEDGPLPWQSGSRGGTPPLRVHACRTGRYDAVWFVPLPC